MSGRDKVERLAILELCEVNPAARCDDPCEACTQAYHRATRALSAALERAERQRDELDLGDSWAALLIAERAKTAQAERERNEAREALEKVRRDERERYAKIVEQFPNGTHIGDIAAAIRGDDNG